jgi:hypothetical protein
MKNRAVAMDMARTSVALLELPIPGALTLDVIAMGGEPLVAGPCRRA